jgi:DNA-directed RNA polymerase subunit RPC12/RpoP
MSRTRTQPPRPAWWSETGPSTCDYCLATFHLEMGYYCADCDRPVCPVCVLAARDRRAVVCPECHTEVSP